MGVISYDDYFSKKKKKKDEEDIAPVKKTGAVISIDDYAKSNKIDLSDIKEKNKKKKPIWASSVDDDDEKIDLAYKTALEQYSGLSKEEIEKELNTIKKQHTEKIKTDDYYTKNREWWYKDKNLIQNVGNVLGKAFLERDAKNFNDDYTELIGKETALYELKDNEYVKNHKYDKGLAGTVEKIGDSFTAGTSAGVKGIDTTIAKITGNKVDTSVSLNEKMGNKAMQESKGVEKVILDVSNSVGRMVPQYILGGGSTAIATAVGFANYGGGAYNDAIRDGYTDEQATKYGLAIGSLEMAMSKALGSFDNLYGKSKLGGKTQAIIDKVIPKIISNKQVRHTLSQFASEGTEEFLQEYVDRVARSTLLDENGFVKSTWETITDTDVLGDALYSAFIGGITGATMDVPSQIDAFRYEKATGRDAETGLTANEQKVIDKVVEKETVERQKQATIEREVNKEIQEQEKTFGTLTDAEKKGIKQSIQEKIDSGELDITGTKLSKKELETIKSEVRTELEKGYIDIDTIEDTFSSEEKAQIRELEQQLANTKSDTEKAQIEAKIEELRGVISNNLKGKLDNDTYLQRSYEEKAKEKQKFEYEVKETDSEYRKVLTEEFKAKAKNTTKTHETYEMLVKMSEDKQTQYHITNDEELKKLGYEVDGKDVNGLVRVTEDGDTRVLVNIDSKKALNRIVGHETTHLLEGTTEYTKLQQLVKEYATTKGDYDTKLKNIKNLYKDVENADIDGEVTADLVGDYLFTDKDFVNNLSVKEPNIFQKIFNEIKHLYKMATAGSKEARQLEKVKKTFEDAYRKNGKVSEDVKYSLTEELENNLDKVMQNKKAMIDYFNDYIETEGITNPTEQDIRNSLDSYDVYDAEDGFNQEAEAEYFNTIKEYLNNKNEYSLSNPDEQIAPSRNDVFGSDIKLQVEEAIAPLKEEISELKETLEATTQQVETNLTTEDYSNTLTEEDLPYFEQQYQEDLKNVGELEYAPINENLTIEEQDELETLESMDDRFGLEGEELDRYNELLAKQNNIGEETYASMEDASIKKISKNFKKHLGLKKPQVEVFEKGIKELSAKPNLTKEDVFNFLDKNYGTESIKVTNDSIVEAQGYLRETGLNVSDIVKGDIRDYFQFRQSNFGKIRFSKDGASVDQNYQELNSMFPDLFPSDIYAESDQLIRMSEVANMQKYDVYNEKVDLQEEAEFIYESILDYRYNEGLKASDEALKEATNYYKTARVPADIIEDIAPVRRNVDWDGVEDTSQGNQIAFNDEGETVEVVSELEKKQQREYKKLGTKEDYISNSAFELYEEVKELKKGKKASYELGRVLDVAFANINELTKEMTPTDAQEVKNAIWRDVTTALLNVKAKPLETVNKNSTIEAVIRQNISRDYESKKNDIANMKEEDLVTKTKKELRKELLIDENDTFINALDNAKNRSMGLMNNTDTIRNTELVFGREKAKIINEKIFQREIDNEADSIAWQNQERQEIKDLGIKARSKESAAVQKYGEKQYVEDNGEVVSYTEEDLAREFPNVKTQEKIKNAAKVIRSKYDNYIDKANEVLTKLGFDPIPKRNDYMRHFQELNDVFSRYGIPFNARSMEEHILPTDINGLTENWSPQKNYFASMQTRKGLKTTYDAITGVDGYIGGIANLIYHTEDIQRGRAFEELIRETYGEDKGFENLENLPEELQEARIEKIQNNHLSNYAAWVHEWTNNIAGKKHKIDRSVESLFGRKAFAVLDEVRKQVGSNMIGLNLSSSLTNLIAPIQASAKTNKLAVVKGTADTIKNMFVKDDFMSKNKFLTARMGTDMISKNAWQKMQDAGFIFMKGMDWFSSNQIVRSKYYELRAKGLSEAEAHSQAGQFAARILGDRTKGANAQLYNSKLVGLVTQFQLEVNNQLYSMFYDTYHESKENAKNNALKTAAGMTFTLGQLFAFTHLFGQTFEAVAGYNPTFDVIEMLKTALGWGEDDDEEETTSERLKKSADMLVDALPYVNILTGGGRIPVASGIPNLVAVATGGKDQYGNEVTLGDELKKLLYLVPPTGGNQFKKTTQGLGMFDDELPVKGSYTDSGNLRFPVEDTPLNRVQAAIFGQYANENAGNYFDNERQPLKEKQIQEFADLDIPIADYWEYREGLSGLKTNEEKIEYISGLDFTDEQKNIMVNNATNTKYTNDKGYIIYKDKNNKNYYYDEENNVLYDSSDDEVDISKLYELTKYEGKDISNYDNFDSYEEFDYSMKNPRKYKLITQIDSYENYKTYEETIEDIKKQYRADDSMSSKQKTALSKQRKRAVQDYINSLSLGVPQKIMLQKAVGNYSIKDYEKYMYGYINSLDLTTEDKQELHSQLFD